MAISSTEIIFNGKDFLPISKVHLVGQADVLHDLLIINKASTPTSFTARGGPEEGTPYSSVMDVSSAHQVVTANGAVDGKPGRKTVRITIRTARARELNLAEVSTNVRALGSGGAMISVFFVIPPLEATRKRDNSPPSMAKATDSNKSKKRGRGRK